ncbi:MAG: type II toxin-antitoxin system RelE/ParE family toxin [Patescibacteria group bacterium]|nr:type II toxin-antitoxin system RelE/ParE family toxin [Patescibacteria group bacterium]
MKIEYKVKFYINQISGKSFVLEYIYNRTLVEQRKFFKYIDFLREHKGYLDEPYSKHVVGKIRELRINVSNNYHRIFYFTFVNKNIIILHAFLKRTDKTPKKEINKALDNYQEVISNKELYE